MTAAGNVIRIVDREAGLVIIHDRLPQGPFYTTVMIFQCSCCHRWGDPTIIKQGMN